MTEPIPGHTTAGPTTLSQDFLAAALATLMPLGAGFMMLIGYAWINIFGVLLGAAGAVAWGYWWYGRNGTFFPKNLRGGSVGGIAALVAVLAVLWFLSL